MSTFVQIAPYTLVEDKEGRRGVTVPDYWGMSEGDPGYQVVWDGCNMVGGSFTPYEELKAIGPENAVADFDRCSRGGGESACIFAGVRGDGIHCLRFSDYRVTLTMGKMRAKFNPTKMFPACQTEGFDG